jgi:hypothetical protein
MKHAGTEAKGRWMSGLVKNETQFNLYLSVDGLQFGRLGISVDMH